ncbi:PAS domain-containing protein [Ensifer soli]|uniref:PAS domain-containing protein n=1 Tax=Ciceribacter sp. sgz301302 TaxID=3342379 RepID=UPI0035BB7ED3
MDQSIANRDLDRRDVILAAGLAYAAFALLGIAIQESAEPLSSLWLANATAVGILWDRREARFGGIAAVGAASLAANLLMGHTLAPSVFFSAVNLVDVTAGLLLSERVVRVTPSAPLTPLGFLARVVIVGFVAPALSGLVAMVLGRAAGFPAGSGFFIDWWLGAALGAIVILPVRLALTREAVRELRRPRALAGLVFWTFVCALTASLSLTHLAYPFIVMLLPLLLAALVTGPLTLAIAAATCVTAIVGIGWLDMHSPPAFQAYPLRGNLHVFAALVVVAPVTASILMDTLRQQYRRLREIESRWAVALESGNQGVWDFDAGTGSTYTSPVWKRMLGLADDAVGGHPDAWLAFLHPDDAGRVREAHRRSIEEGDDAYEETFRMRHADGRWIWILDRARVIERDVAGRARRMIGTHTDITAQKEAEEQLRLLSRRMQLATRAGGVGIWEWNETRKHLTWDDQMMAIYGIDRAGFTGTAADWEARLHPDDRERSIVESERGLRHGTLVDSEFRIVTPAGQVRTVRSLSSRVTLPGVGTLLIGCTWDITPAKKAEERLRLANESLGHFAAIAAHDLQAPLRHIALFAGQLDDDIGATLGGEQRDALRHIAASAERLRVLVKSLLAFSATTDPQPVCAPVALRTVVDAAIAHLSAEIVASRARIDIGWLPVLPVDAVLMTQVFQNLIGNALRYGRPERPLILIRHDEDRGFHLLSVTDDGPGIDPAGAETIFEPFVRMPGAGPGGLGIGLSLVRRIVQAHGGRVFLDTDHRPGCRMVVGLPSPADGRGMPASLTAGEEALSP